jgi:hypothetical protein
MSSSTSMVAAAETSGSTTQGGTINILLNYGGGRCRSSRSTPRGPAIDVWLNLVPVASIFLVTPNRWPLW